MFKLGCVVLVLLFSSSAFADVFCEAKIKQIYKASDASTISILLENSDSWIAMPTKSDESMALLAFASKKTVIVKWEDPNITACSNSWVHNTPLKGWFLVKDD